MLERIKPLFRWAGGKTQLLPQLLEYVPKKYGTYHEPFLGGGALFFALAPTSARLTDLNVQLINAYEHVRSNIQDLVVELHRFERSSTCFYHQRKLFNEWHGFSVETAARFVYLNRTCFNGLWRENSRGEFNVPYGGDRKSKAFFDAGNLLSCSIALRNVEIFNESFEQCERYVKENDLVYFDPPYVPVSATSFVDYVADGFGHEQHVALRDLARRLKERGAHVILSNSDTPVVRELYEGFDLHEVLARRSINRNGAGRGPVGELIIT